MTERRNIDWPWAVGGTNDGASVPESILRVHRPFLMPKGELPQHGEPISEEASLEQETYIPRQITTGETGLRVTFYACSDLSERAAREQAWEQLCDKAMSARLMPDVGDVAEELRNAAVNLRVGEGLPADPQLAETMRNTAQVLGNIPTCPKCQGWLIHRRPDQRFMEANHYVQCQQGHTFELVETRPLPDGKTASEIIELVIEGHAPQLKRA